MENLEEFEDLEEAKQEEFPPKKFGTYQKVLLSLSLALSLGCVYGWLTLGKFVNDFEESLALSESLAQKTEVESPLSSSEEEEKYLDLALEVAESYAKFTSADLDYADIQGFFQEGSDILDLLASYNSKRYNSHEGAYFQNILQETPVQLGDSTVKCQVSFDYMVITSEETLCFPSAYVLYFNQKSGKVFALEMA